jgi:archaellin
MIIKHLEQKNQTYKNIKFNALSVKGMLNGLANAGSQQIDFSKSTIQVILTRDNKPHVIATQNLKILGLASTLDTLNQSAFATTAPLGEQLVTGQTAMVSFQIPLGGVIDLHGDDEIYIEVQNSSGLFTDVALEASSFLEIKPVKCYGVEKYIPRIRAYVIQANESANQYMLSDNLIRLAFLNFDRTDFKSNVINNLVFSSDRLDETYTYADLIAKKLTSYGKQIIPTAANDIASQLQEDQSFLLTDFHEEYDNVQLDIQFNGVNVTASNNYIVAWNYDTDWTIVQKAIAKEAEHDNITKKKLDAATLKKAK